MIKQNVKLINSELYQSSLGYNFTCSSREAFFTKEKTGQTFKLECEVAIGQSKPEVMIFWHENLSWNGEDEISTDELAILQDLVDQANSVQGYVKLSNIVSY